MILRLLPRRCDNWADPTEWGLLPYMDFLLYFLNHRVLRKISYSVILVKHQSPRVSVTVHTHHLPLELWHTHEGHADVLFNLPSRTHCPATRPYTCRQPVLSNVKTCTLSATPHGQIDPLCSQRWKLTQSQGAGLSCLGIHTVCRSSPPQINYLHYFTRMVCTLNLCWHGASYKLCPWTHGSVFSHWRCL